MIAAWTKLERRQPGFWFAVFRIAFGTYLVWHFCTLVPSAVELFSRVGMVPDPAVNPGYETFPSLFFVVDSPEVVVSVVLALAVCAVLFTLGVYRRVAAVILWFGYASLLHRNFLILNVSSNYVGWLLMASALVPAGEPWSLRPRARASWAMPPPLLWGAWIVLALSYSVNGYLKFSNPIWRTGAAFSYIIPNDRLVHDWFVRDVMLWAPAWVHQANTWFAMMIELTFLPLALFRSTRKVAWLCMTAVHLMVMLVFRLHDLSLGMLMFHLFIIPGLWEIPGLEDVIWRRGAQRTMRCP